MSNYADNDALNGRAAIVTGGSRGIGRAIALRLAEGGVLVAVAARGIDAAESVADEIRSAGGRAIAVACDVRQAADVRRLVDETVAAFTRIDVLVNNAGVSPRRERAEDLTEVDWDVVLDTNLKGPFLLSQAVLPVFIERGGGVIINVASIAGLAPIPRESAYVASKAGLIGLTKALAYEWARHGVRVHAVTPGYVATEMNATVRERAAQLALDSGRDLTDADSVVVAAHRSATGRTLLGRYGAPEEIADVVVFLASSRATYMTGAVTLVDGGWMIGDMLSD